METEGALGEGGQLTSQRGNEEKNPVEGMDFGEYG